MSRSRSGTPHKWSLRRPFATDALANLAAWFLLAAVLPWLAGCQPASTVAKRAPGGVPPITVADRFYDVVALSESRVLVIGDVGAILLSDDAGANWERAPSGTDLALYAIASSGRSHAWIVGQEGLILHSRDGGKTWSRQTSGTDATLLGVDFLNDRDGWAVGEAAEVVRTTDGGATWVPGTLTIVAGESDQDAPLAPDPVLYDVQFLDTAIGWIVGEFGSVFRTDDGGATWRPRQQAIAGLGLSDVLDPSTFFGIAFADAANGILAGSETRIASTGDGGTNWRFEALDSESATGDPLYQPFQGFETDAWVVGASGLVLRRDVGGGPWRRVGLGSQTHTWLRGVYFLNRDDGWVVGARGLILHTIDGGRRWRPALG